MTRRATIARFGAIAILALLMSACIKLDMALTVNDDDTVDGTIVFALNKQLIELTGQSADDLMTDAPLPTDVEGVSTEPYEDEEFQGQEITLDSVPLSEFNQDDPDALSIERQGDRFVVSGALDLSDAATGATGATGGTGATGFPGAEEFLRSAELRVAITFPGEVIDSNGEIDGNTVTWEPTFGERLELQATASAEGGGGSSMMILLIVGAAVIVAAIVIGLLVARRRQAAPAMAGGGPIGGQGPMAPPPAPTPPPASTPPPPAAPPPPPPSDPQP